MKSIFKKTSLAVALSAVLGVSANAQAATVSLSWAGAFTMLALNSNTSDHGVFIYSSDTTGCYPGSRGFYNNSECVRAAITGTLTYDSVSGAGSGTIAPFSFLGDGALAFASLSLQTIGNGMGGPGPLVLGNMSFNFYGTEGIPASIVWNASGLLSALNGGVSVGQSITGGALAASDNTVDAYTGETHPMGPAIMATTTWNTTNIGTVVLGSNPSGTLPLITDTTVDTTNGDIGIGGSPMRAGRLTGLNVNIDIVSAQVTNVPIPSAVWLFGSGLSGLVSLARRRRG